MSFSENRGKLLENLVAIELRRRGDRFFYFRDRTECDFIVVINGHPHTATQVCWEVEEKNQKRELAGIIQASEALNVKNRFFLTYDQTDLIEGISSKPVWLWLLEEAVSCNA